MRRETRWKYHPDRGPLRHPSGWYLEEYDTRLAQWWPIRAATPTETERLEAKQS